MKYRKDGKRLTLLGILTLVLLTLVGLTAMGIAMHKQDLKNNWKTQNTVTLEGHQACLPHKNPDQPHTLECAAGLKVGDVYYTLKYNGNSPGQLAEGTVVVTGIYSAPVSNDRYDTVGTLEVKSITKKR